MSQQEPDYRLFSIVCYTFASFALIAAYFGITAYLNITPQFTTYFNSIPSWDIVDQTKLINDKELFRLSFGIQGIGCLVVAIAEIIAGIRAKQSLGFIDRIMVKLVDPE